MKLKHPTITIGIPAYNEEANIKQLLDTLLNQSQNTITLEKIIVASDGSTDQTVEIVRTFPDPRITCFEDGKRIGSALRKNRILENTTSDILILLNADVSVEDPGFIEKLTEPIRTRKADLTSCRMEAFPPTNIFQRALFASIRIKQDVYERLNNGQSIYTCHGRACAFSKLFYKDFRFADLAADDAYSYLTCIAMKKLYGYVSRTSAHYRLPASITDHERQSVRFLQTKKHLFPFFGKSFVVGQYTVPVSLVIGSFLRSLISKPRDTILYIMIFTYMILRSIFTNYTRSVWEVSLSTKK